MRFEEKRSLAEIAATLRKREAAVSMMMVRIRRWLRACVDESMALDQARVP
jgi:DNA-directed RNA polymerase specialized sigma24 family protein